MTETTAHPPNDMIAAYAAGRLPRGFALAVAGHLGFCGACRDRLRRMQSLCGALLATEAPRVAPTERCLDKVLARITGRPRLEPMAPAVAPSDLPAALCGCLTSPSRLLGWRPVADGIERCRLDGFPAEKVELVRAAPGCSVPRHGHDGTEATLVLEGQVRDGRRIYGQGDLSLCDERVEHSPATHGAAACLYLVVAPEPSLQPA